jgi:hypothetical protein
MIPKVVAVEMAVVEMEPTAPVAEMVVDTAPELGTTVAPEVRLEARVGPLPGASTDVVVCEPVIKEVALICSAPMSETTSSSCGGLEVLNDNLTTRLSLGGWSRGAVQSSGSSYVASTLSSLGLRITE